jgi:hypothetical protein
VNSRLYDNEEESQSLINTEKSTPAATAARSFLIRGLLLLSSMVFYQYIRIIVKNFDIAIGFGTLAVLALFLPYFLNMYSPLLTFNRRL